MNSFKRLFLATAALLSASVSSATTLTSYISMDNGFIAYLSTSDSTDGTAFSSANDWYNTYSGTTAPLAANTDYYLHVRGYDQGGIAGFLGRFELSGSTHLFANGSTTLLTNTTDWKGNNIGFNGTYSSVIALGNNGVGPWNTRPSIPNSATWIWAGHAHNNDNAFFTTKISAVATPDAASSAALILFGLTGLVALRRFRRNS